MIATTVLFANDDVLTQWVMSEVLSKAGFDVVSACRGSQVLDLLSDVPDFDIMLLDVTLPDLKDDDHIVRCWRRLLPGRPIVYTGPSRDCIKGSLGRTDRFIRSPFSAGSLLRAVDAALEDACYQPVITAASGHMSHVH